MSTIVKERNCSHKISTREKKRKKPYKFPSSTKKGKTTPTMYYNEGVLGARVSADWEEEEVGQAIFNGEGEVLEQLDSEGETNIEDTLISPGDIQVDDIQVDEEHEQSSTGSAVTSRKAAWVDEDDEILTQEITSTFIKCHRSVLEKGDQSYAEFLRQKHTEQLGKPKWADENIKKKSEDSDEDSEDEILRTTGNFITKSTTLPKGIIDTRSCGSLNVAKKGGIVKSVEFCTTAKVALVAGLNGIVTLYQVDGKINPLIQSVVFDNFPIHTAHFSIDGKDIIVGSKTHGFFFYYDMFSGKIVRVPWQKDMDQKNVQRFEVSPDGKILVIYGRSGNMHILSARTKEWIDTVKMNSDVNAINFNKDGSKMYSHGSAGKVFVWDMYTRQCIHRFNDLGCIKGTSIALSPNGQYVATGSDSGVVNVYESASVLSSINPEPLKMIMNLTTEVTNLKFNSTSEILAMSSRHKLNGLKLVHFPSISVFSNFPNLNYNHHYIGPLDFSAYSGYLTYANNTGKAYLYRLQHFQNF